MHSLTMIDAKAEGFPQVQDNPINKCQYKVNQKKERPNSLEESVLEELYHIDSKVEKKQHSNAIGSNLVCCFEYLIRVASK